MAVMVRMLMLACLITMAMETVAGYDWMDSDFNMVIQNDIEDNIDYVENQYLSLRHRTARQAVDPVEATTEKDTRCRPSTRPTGNNRYQRTCCGERDDLKLHGDALKEIRRDCFAEVKRARGMRNMDSEQVDMFNCEKVQKTKDDFVCVMECVARKKDLVDTEGNLKADNVTNFIKEEMDIKEWQKKIVDVVLEKCLKEMNESNADKITPSNIETSQTDNSTTLKPTLARDIARIPKSETCNPSTLKFSHCIWREMQLSCPKDMVRDSRACERMRDRLQKKEYPEFSTSPNRRNTTMTKQSDKMKS